VVAGHRNRVRRIPEPFVPASARRAETRFGAVEGAHWCDSFAARGPSVVHALKDPGGLPKFTTATLTGNLPAGLSDSTEES
jgi:hypothetical protein